MATDFADIQRFWARTLPAIGGPALRRLSEPQGYRPSEPGSLPVCNGGRLNPSVAADNAFYCRQENVVVYDAEGLVPGLGAQFGRRAVGVLLAHEYGHAIQSQLGDYDVSIRLELQADCFAGAWAASTTDQDGGDGGVGGVLRAFLASVQGAGKDEQTAHGSGFDRVAAYALGARDGAQRCLDRSALPPSDRARPDDATTDDGRSVNPTRDLASLLTRLEATLRRGSGTPIEVVLRSAAEDPLSCNGSRSTDEFAGRVVACPGERRLVLDDALLADLWSRDGDLAAGYLLVRGYLQTQLAADRPALDRTVLERTVECRTGAALADLVRSRDPALRLYTADLDEVIAGVADVTPTSPGLVGDSPLSVIERIDQLRRGYDAGAAVCGR